MKDEEGIMIYPDGKYSLSVYEEDKLIREKII